jgi:hypothetical protein
MGQHPEILSAQEYKNEVRPLLLPGPLIPMTSFHCVKCAKIWLCLLKFLFFLLKTKEINKQNTPKSNNTKSKDKILLKV